VPEPDDLDDFYLDLQLRNAEIDLIRHIFMARHREDPEGGYVEAARMTDAILRILQRLMPVWEKDPKFEEIWNEVAMGHYITAGQNPSIWPYLWQKDNLDALEAIADLLWRHRPKEVHALLKPKKPKDPKDKTNEGDVDG